MDIRKPNFIFAALCSCVFSMVHFSVAIAAIPNTSANAVPRVRVKIGQNLRSLTVKGTDLVKDLKLIGKKESFSGRREIKFNCNSSKSSKNYKPAKPVLLASLFSNTGVIQWESSKYRGKLKVVASDGYQSCDLVNETDMEDYISSLLSKEMNAKWPIEVLKAQAIAARTYALNKIRKNKENIYDMENSEKHQVNGTLMDQTPKTAKVTRKTKGLILVSKKTKKLAKVFFHSKCGGRTLTPDLVWANKVEGYQEVDCPFCHKYGKKNWKNSLSKAEFRSTLDTILERYYGEEPKKSSNFMMYPDKKYNRKIVFYKNGNRFQVKKAQIRKILGRKTVPSNNYKVKVLNNQIQFVGDGYGHGVGLCQLGAFELAKRGYTYEQILAYYFPQHEIKKIY